MFGDEYKDFQDGNNNDNQQGARSRSASKKGTNLKTSGKIDFSKNALEIDEEAMGNSINSYKVND